MRKNLFLIFLGTTVFLTENVYSDIKGVIFEKGRKVKLSDINVYIPSENVSTVTNKQGEFTLPYTKESAEIKINASGFIPFTITLQNNTDSNLYLEKKSNPKGSLSLTVEDTNYKKDQSQKTLTRQQVFDMPGANGDAVKAVQNLPGINRGQGFSSQVIIQGSAPKDTAYDFEGHEIPLVFHFGGLSSVIMPEAVDKVDYFSAGHQAERSRALGGIISLSTRQPEVSERNSKGLFYVDNLSLGGLFESKINEQQSFLISGRYSYVGAFLKAATKNNESLNLTVAPEFYDITAVYNYKLSENENLKVSFIDSNDKLGFVFNEPLRQDPSIRGDFSNSVNFFRLVPVWEKQISDKDILKLSLAYGIDQLNVNIGENYFDLNSKSFSTRSHWEHVFNEQLKLTSGWDNLYSNATVKTRLPVSSSSGGVRNPISSGEVREADVKSRSNNLGVFTELEYKVSPEYKITPGLRADYFSVTKENFALPRLAMQYKYNDSLIYKMGSGMYVQSPEPQESSSEFGNEDIKSPQAYHLSLGFDKDFKEGQADGHFFSLNGFYKKMDHLVISSSQKKIKNGIEVFEIYNNEGSGLSYGLESQWKYRYNEWQLTLAYTWSKSTRKTPSAGEYNFEYDQTHNLNLIAMYSMENNWKISSRFRYVTGNPYTPVIGAVYDADNETYFPVRGGLYSERNNPFQQLDIRIDKKVILDEEIWTFYLDIQNILNTKNPEGVQYSYDYSIKKEVTGLPLLPSIGVRGEF